MYRMKFSKKNMGERALLTPITIYITALESALHDGLPGGDLIESSLRAKLEMLVCLLLYTPRSVQGV
jgi:hypothetical protein